ncbi:MAG: Acetoin:2,6-dichlorophenolindophenol oxidoreductase subunit alpha [Lentisphaerae bacterium ADurb.BinA184]|nr:MAG: Acetoin:2,6-dichlorophenolindophenol oxidoreductase subunit alpha [Lentisphaerae bacterium ADurb.BinA184]
MVDLPYSEIARYRLMLLIRRFEETVEELFSRGQIQGTTHPCTGQEATAVGVCAALGPGDAVTSTHRGHGHFLARGGDPNRMMAELYGKATGYSGGRGGSQLMADYALGFLGGNGITGGSIPVATGVALAIKMQGRAGVAACFLGDGASNQGTFHESLNMAGLWKLPVLYVCENNQYAMSMPVRASVPIADIADRAAGYGLPGVVVDGNDVEAVQAAAAAARARALAGEGATLIECKTYRLSGHSRGDQRRYRTRQEEAAARERDPINRWRDRLFERGLLDEAADQALRAGVEEAVRDAVRFAESSPYPDPATLGEGVFA